MFQAAGAWRHRPDAKPAEWPPHNDRAGTERIRDLLAGFEGLLDAAGPATDTPTATAACSPSGRRPAA